MSLAALNLDMFDAKPAPVAPQPVAIVAELRTNNGNTILVCNVDPIPETEIQRAIEAGLAIFGPSEIAHMRKVTPRLKENPAQETAVINAKLTFPRASILQSLDLTTAGRKRAA